MMMLQNKVPRARLGIAEASDDDDDEPELEDEAEMAREVIFSNDTYKDIEAGCIISPCVVHALRPDQGLPIEPGPNKVRHLANMVYRVTCRSTCPTWYILFAVCCVHVLFVKLAFL